MTSPLHITHQYLVHYPEHKPRADDPHYKDFESYRRKTKDLARCAIDLLIGDKSLCNGPLELHHSHIEFALVNGVDLALLEHLYPGVSTVDEVGAWVESADNLQWLCLWHHRGHGGVHCASAADYASEPFVRGLIT